MSLRTRNSGRPFTVYLTAQVVGLLFALAVGWASLRAEIPVWGAAACWVLVSTYLSRKRLPSEAVGAALQFGAVGALLAPLAPYLRSVLDGANVGAVAVATELFGPILAVVVVAGFAYVVGLLLKRRAERKLSRQARKNVYRSG